MRIYVSKNNSDEYHVEVETATAVVVILADLSNCTYKSEGELGDMTLTQLLDEDETPVDVERFRDRIETAIWEDMQND
jgi:hypothetical protein